MDLYLAKISHSYVKGVMRYGGGGGGWYLMWFQNLWYPKG